MGSSSLWKTIRLHIVKPSDLYVYAMFSNKTTHFVKRIYLRVLYDAYSKRNIVK
jgi:hypothetical protein